MSIIESRGKHYIQRGRSVVQTFNGFADLMSDRPIVMWSSLSGCSFDNRERAVEILTQIKKVQAHRKP